jgi:hypothetical protein
MNKLDIIYSCDHNFYLAYGIFQGIIYVAEIGCREPVEIFDLDIRNRNELVDLLHNKYNFQIDEIEDFLL